MEASSGAMRRRVPSARRSASHRRLLVNDREQALAYAKVVRRSLAEVDCYERALKEDMKATERHKLKENEFARGVGQARGLVQHRRREMTSIAAVVLLLLVAVAGYSWWRSA